MFLFAPGRLSISSFWAPSVMILPEESFDFWRLRHPRKRGEVVFDGLDFFVVFLCFLLGRLRFLAFFVFSVLLFLAGRPSMSGFWVSSVANSARDIFETSSNF